MVIKKTGSNNFCHPDFIKILTQETKKFERPLSDLIIGEYGKDPFLILMSCLLSLRAKDTVTIQVCRDLFRLAQTPEQIVHMPVATLEKIIHKIGFYKNKAHTLRYVSRVLLEKYNGIVPETREELLAITGIGPKTASLVLGQAYDIPSICVDVHVHRISNRLGFIKTKTPGATELALQKLLPKKEWINYNTLLVMWGQNICTSVSPKCRRCALNRLCARVGVVKSR